MQTNKQRAARAEKAIRFLQQEKLSPRHQKDQIADEASICDLLTDLLHLADQQSDWSLRRFLRVALTNFEEEGGGVTWEYRSSEDFELRSGDYESCSVWVDGILGKIVKEAPGKFTVHRCQNNEDWERLGDVTNMTLACQLLGGSLPRMLAARSDEPNAICDDVDTILRRLEPESPSTKSSPIDDRPRVD